MANSAGKRLQTYDLFVGNLPLDADEKFVGKLFSKFGETKGIFVKDSNTIPKKRFAFVNFLCEPDAEQAVKEINGQNMNGSKLVVRRQESRKRVPNKRENDDKSRASQNDYDTSSVSLGGWSSAGEVIKDDVLTPFLYSTGMKEIVIATYVENPVTVWIQTVTEENTSHLTNIMEQLVACCPAAPKVKGIPQTGKVYAAMFSEDGEWYRCIVKQSFGSEILKVQYIDFGNTEEIQASALLEIPPTVASHKPMAYKIVLHNTKAKDVTDQNGIRFLKKLTENRQLLAYKMKQLQDGTGFYGYLSIEGDPVNINDKVVNEGFASKRPSMGFRGGGGESPSHSSVSSLAHAHMAGDDGSMGSNNSLNSYIANESGYSRSSSNSPKLMNHNVNKLQYSGKSPQNSIMPSSFNFPPPLMKSKYTSPNKGMNNFYNANSTDSGSGQPRAEEIAHHLEIQKTLQNDVSKKKREIDKLRTDLARKELELQQASSNKVQIRSVVELAKKVKSLRLQFPTGRASGLDEAVELALSGERITNSSATSLQQVITAVSTYRALQKEICNAKDMEELDSLVETRDLARKNLHEKLTDCVQELEVMPLDDRHNCVSIKKREEFSCVRENSNMCAQEVAKAFRQIEGMMDLEAEDCAENVNFEINTLLKTYMQALQQEIAITDMERSQDSSLVATVLTAILNELHGEIAVLDNFRQFMAEFSQMKAGIEPWLDSKPNFDGVQECRKNIRALKSKLRHKEADRQDFEESGENEEEKVVKAEIQGLQYQLHQSLVTHDQLVLDLAKIADSHFPELLVKHHDTGIRTYLDYSGIVKTGWEMEHFALTPAVRPGMYSSTFCGNPVYVQEYHIGDSEHLRKEDFLAQIMAYYSICSDCLVAVQAVFFTKNERIGYVILNAEEMRDLETFMNEPGFDDKRRQKIARGVTSALNTLHQHGFVHGEVNPQNVGVMSDGAAVLLCPDFSRSLFDRTKRGYMTSHGMMFQAPEILNTHQSAPVQITTKTDLYLLGLVILYLHHPRSVIPASRDGTPNLAVLSLDSETGSLLYNLLCGKPDMRIAASHLLKSGYLTRTFKDVSLSPSLDRSAELEQESYDPFQDVVDSTQPQLTDELKVASQFTDSTQPQLTDELKVASQFTDGTSEEEEVPLSNTQEQLQRGSGPASHSNVVSQESFEAQSVAQKFQEQLQVDAVQACSGGEDLSPLLQNPSCMDFNAQNLSSNGLGDVISQSVKHDSIGCPKQEDSALMSDSVGLTVEEAGEMTARLEQNAKTLAYDIPNSLGNSAMSLPSPKSENGIADEDIKEAPVHISGTSSPAEGMMTREKLPTNVDKLVKSLSALKDRGQLIRNIQENNVQI
ncbi:serine/threonine-protein kinase 31-like isoform X3 [Ostrea edulis]|uniref:serine/threonine-protein kinase 31-like isoform X3 n=1 Tax=Ostrea edulis TaxID=37623 RepID=UPI0024AF1494|nr:serine/threonine-protein kinase 31-like isoform X3 [Ostrea edulis]